MNELHEAWPLLSVVVPARDDAASLPATIEAIRAQEYPGEREIVVAVGPSSDGTYEVARHLAEQYPTIRVVDNPAGSTPAALNAAIAASRGEVIARIDAHAEPTPGYLALAVEVLRETGAANVGGVQLARGEAPFQRAVAAAMSSRFGTGDARFHYGGPPGPSDTVYLGVYRRETLEQVGGFDESLMRNQDYELNVRLRDAGGVVWFDPRLQVVYRPRSSLRTLARQYFDYGRWKQVVVRRHPRSLRWRQLVPPAAALANVAGVLLGVAGIRAAWLIPGTYTVATVAASIHAARDEGGSVMIRLPFVFATMHHAWGFGFLVGAKEEERRGAPQPRG
jgi:succinoglycan biosynthesis protein ExoA